MTTTTAPRNTGSLLVWIAAAALLLLLLLLPAIAIRFTAEVQWSALDFATWAAMLTAAAGGYELLARRAPNRTYRAGVAVALLTAFLLVWINLAVGIIDSERNDANLMYAGVLAVAVGGACIARLRSGGMAAAMLATAGAQVAVAVVALATGTGREGGWPLDLIGVTAMLTALWLGSAWLFRSSSPRP